MVSGDGKNGIEVNSAPDLIARGIRVSYDSNMLARFAKLASIAVSEDV